MGDSISTNSRMTLADLPVEMLYCIVDQLDYTWDVSALCLVNRRLYEVLNPYLYLVNKQYSRYTVMQWAVKNGRRELILTLFPESLDPAHAVLLPWRPEIHAAFQKGHIDVAEFLLDVGEDIHSPSEWAKKLLSLLRFSVEQEHEAIVRLVLQRGAILDLSRSSYLTFKNLGVAKALIEYAPPSSQELTALFHNFIWCPLSSTTEIVDLCLEKGADLAAESRDGKGLLYLAVLGRNPETVRHLLQLGVGFELWDGTRLEPLMRALEYKEFGIVRLLLEHVNVEEAIAEAIDIESLLLAAAACGPLSIVQQIVKSGSSPGMFRRSPHPGSVGDKALARAARFGQIPTARLLLDQGANPHPRALLCAIHSGSVPMVQMLLDAGANPNYHLHCSTPPALNAAAKHETLFRLLLDRGAEGVLIWKDAVRGGIAQVQMLLEQGKALDRNNYSILDDAISAGPPMLELIYGDAYKSNVSKMLHRRPWLARHPIEKLHLETFTWLAKKGFTKDLSPLGIPNTICLLLAGFRLEDAVKGLDLLLENGGDINAKAADGNRAIWLAVARGLSEPAMKALLARGADPSLLPDETPALVAGQLLSTKRLDFILGQMIPVWDWNAMRDLLSILKKNARNEKCWPRVRIVERFQYQHGFGC